ncbi:hypothetical protein CN229_30795, partial [Sinorhizobium meliloti]
IERPPRSSWRICANARSALLFTRQCCTWIRFSREGTFGQLAADRPVHGACLSKVDTWRTDSRIKEEELRQQTC